MNRTMAIIVWLLLCSLTCHPAKVFGFTHNLQSIEVSTADQTEIYDKERTAEINLQDIEVSTADQIEIYDKERTAEIISNSNVDIEEAVSSQYTRQAEESSVKDCDYLSVTKESEQPRKIKEIHNETYSFFLRPKENFVKLIIQMRLQDKLDISSKFYAKKNIELHSWDLDNQENKWVKIQVEYHPHVLRGPNYHALRVTVDNTTHSMVTNYWQLIYTYEGFDLSTEGEVELLFNCSPEEYLGEIPLPSSKWKWILAGCMMSVTLMLGGVCCAVMSKKKSENQHDVSSPSSSHVYEEFDEEVLAKIRQKVEILREGRVYENSDCVSKDNHYVVLQMVPLQQSSIPDTCAREETEEEEEAGKEEQEGEGKLDDDHYKVPSSIKREENLQQKVCLQENVMKNDCYTEENHYETLYPLDNSLSTSNEALNDVTITTTTLPQNHLASRDVEGHSDAEENPYENLYMAT